MNSIRNWVTIMGLTIAAFALCATGARSQSLATTQFSGTFTLPFETQWGRMTLPAGKYSLYYGHMYDDIGVTMVEVIGEEKKAPHGFILAPGVSDSSTTKSALVCVREGKAGIVRALEMPQIGRALQFRMTRGAQLTANRSNGKKTIQLAEVPMLIQRIPITLNSR